MGSSLNMLPFRRFSYPCGQPFCNCPYVTPAYLQPALIDGYCESQRMLSKAGRLTTTPAGTKTPESLLLVCKVQMQDTCVPGSTRCDPGVPVCQGWGTAGSSTKSLNGSDRLHPGPAALPGLGSALKLHPGPGCVTAVPVPILSQPCHGLSRLCLRALEPGPARAGFQPSFGPGLSESSPGLPAGPAPLAGCPAWLCPGGLGLPVPQSPVPCPQGAKQLWPTSGSCTRCPTPLKLLYQILAAPSRQGMRGISISLSTVKERNKA